MAQHQQSSGGQNGYPDQAHHLLCSNVILKLEAKYDDLAEKAGYNINRRSNGLLMPAYYGHQKLPGLQRHRGGHSRKLYKKVRQLLEPIYDEYYKPNPCENEEAKKEIIGELTEAESYAKDLLRDLDWELYKHSKRLFDGDYRDEGFGEMSLDQPPITNKASGVKWLRDNANTVKRRYKIINGIEVINAKFYDDEGYPVPGDPRS